MRSIVAGGFGRAIGALLIAVVVFAGCSSDSSAPQSKVPDTSAPSGARRSASTTTTTTPPVTTVAAGEASDLRTRLLERGICTTLTNFTPFLQAPVTSLLNCEDGYGIFTFASPIERDQVIDIIGMSDCTAPTFLAVADRWLVLPSPATSVRAAGIVDVLGGEVRELPCPAG